MFWAGPFGTPGVPGGVITHCDPVQPPVPPPPPPPPPLPLPPGPGPPVLPPPEEDCWRPDAPIPRLRPTPRALFPTIVRAPEEPPTVARPGSRPPLRAAISARRPLGCPCESAAGVTTTDDGPGASPIFGQPANET